MSKKNNKETIDIYPSRRIGSWAMQRFAPAEKPKDRKKTFRNLINFYKKESKYIFIVFFLLLFSTIILLIVPRLVGLAVNNIELIQTGEFIEDFAVFIVLIILFCYLFDWIFTTLQGFIMAVASQKIVKNLRKELFNKIQKLPLTYHDTHTHGELMSRLTNDIDNISVTIAASTTQLLKTNQR